MKKNHGFPYKWGIKMRYVLLVLQVALFLPQWGHASNNVLLPGPKTVSYTHLRAHET